MRATPVAGARLAFGQAHMSRIVQAGGAMSWVLLLSQCAVMPPRIHPPSLGDAQWQAADGKRLPFQRWPAAARNLPRSPKAVLVCVHGLSGAASDFWPLGQELPAKDIIVYGVQLRGQGNDPDANRRGDIRNAKEWRRDLIEFHDLVTAKHGRTPVFWLAESMGALIAMHTLVEQPAPPARIRGVVLLSPAVGLRDRVPPWKYLAVRAAGVIAPGKRVSLTAFDEERVRAMRITSDTTQASQAPKTPHFVNLQSLRLLRGIEKMMSSSDEAGRRLTLPILVLYTAHDPVSSREQVESWFMQIASEDKARLFFPNDYHLILHDNDRWEAVSQITRWILRHAGE
jgi:alpha-beta hydrolase superfamily lysophospholipase